MVLFPLPHCRGASYSEDSQFHIDSTSRLFSFSSLRKNFGLPSVHSHSVIRLLSFLDPDFKHFSFLSGRERERARMCGGRDRKRETQDPR